MEDFFIRARLFISLCFSQCNDKNILGNHGDHVPLIISGGGHIRRGKAMCLRIRICPSLFDGSHPSSLLATGITLKVLLSLLVNEQFVNRLSLFYLSCYDRSIWLPDTSAYPDVLVSKPIIFFCIQLKLMIIKCHKVWEHIKTGTSIGSEMKKCKRVRSQ